MSVLNNIALRSELVQWLFNNGRKFRDSENQRFGQYIWSKYNWDNQKPKHNDGFYDESPVNAYLKINSQLV